ncbi:phage tail tape measure protein [Variovorax sp. LT2P21]|uniref:phage tail tape measure protein n=1 Tax=Variovorax sp. LT2P21 TaxID=3443731 RepID=UPI003F4889B0
MSSADLKAQISLTADATGVEAGVGKAKRSLADLGVAATTQGKKAADGLAAMGTSSTAAGDKVSANAQRVLKSLEGQANRLSMTAAQYAALRAQTAGVSEAAAPFIARIEAATQPMTNLGMSAKATAAAMRGVPAQFTDIITSLQGGQAPLTVFLQQGGQLKDLFGGIGPAARALGGYVASIITPFTLGATAVGALAVAMYQGSQESQAYAKALILTGNYLGKTTDQLKEQAAQIASTTGTQGQAAEALAKIAQSGKIAADAMTDVGAAVVSMNRVLGTSVDEATAVFAKLSDEPAKASAKLNETMHYLNQTTYDRIRALEEQGRKEEAVALAQSTAATITTQRMKDVEAQAGVLMKAWRALALDAGKAWDAMQGLGRQQTTGEALTAAKQKLSDLKEGGPIGGPVTGKADYEAQLKTMSGEVARLSRKSSLEIDNAFSEGERARSEAAKIASSDRLKTLTDEVKTNADKRKKAIADLNRDYQTLGKATSGPEYDKLVSNINEKYKDPKTPAAKAFQDDAATKFLETLRQTESTLKDQLAGELKITAEQREQVKFQQLIADLKDKKILTAEQKSLLANKDAIGAQLAKNAALSGQIKFEEKIADIVKQSGADAEALRRTVESIEASIASGASGRAEQYDRMIDSLGLGDQARKMVEAEKSIRNEFRRYQLRVDDEFGKKDMLGSDAYVEATAKIKASLDNALASQKKYYADEAAARADWKLGATAALSDYAKYVDDVAGSTGRTLADSFKGAEDAIVQFATTGKLSFSSLANSIIADLVRIAVQQSITGPLAKGVLSLFGGGASASGGGTDVLGAFISGLSASGKAKASGGPVSGGTPYLVGEKGPEVFVPGASGSIVPNNALGGGGGGDTYHYNFTVGDVATKSMVIEAVQSSERRTANGFRRSRSYAGDAA